MRPESTLPSAPRSSSEDTLKGSRGGTASQSTHPPSSSLSSTSPEGLVQQVARIRETLDLPVGLSVPAVLREANVAMGFDNDDGRALPEIAARLLKALGIS